MVKHKLGLESEIERIARIRRHTGKTGRAVALGIGDDCAVLRLPGSAEDLLIGTDLLVEDVHFSRATHSAADCGWKALARGLSDIAAMGGKPTFILVSLVLPSWANRPWIDGFYDGLLKLARREHASLVGGDLAHGDRLVCDIVVAGTAHKGTAMRRGGAKPGDTIWISGALGGSALGLSTQRGAAWKRHLRPEPRLALGNFLRSRLKATAAMDLSDGLSLDLRRLCLASGLHAEIAEPPRFRGASLEQALHGGEDYELLFTTSPNARVPQNLGGIPLTPIGVMRRGTPGEVLLHGTRLEALGYDHFRTL